MSKTKNQRRARMMGFLKLAHERANRPGCEIKRETLRQQIHALAERQFALKEQRTKNRHHGHRSNPRKKNK